MFVIPKRAALAAALLSAFPLHAETVDEAAVIVTATRFADIDPRVPANISVITRKDIDSLPAATLPDVLRTRAGINVRALYGPMATDATVDLRGFGDSAAGNTLILLDGQRLNPIDASSISWSAIPLAGVQRIEILRGSGAVLYGDRATGGVINIVTDKSDKPTTSAAVTAGSFGYRALDARVAGVTGPAYANLTGHFASADGWRDNSQTDQQSLAGRVGRRGAGGEGFVDFALYKDSAGSPGALFTNAYLNQPQTARFPLDNQSRDGYRLRPGFAWSASPSVDVEAELGQAGNRYHTRNFTAGAPSFVSDRDSDTLSVTPRLRWRHGLGAMGSETVFGFDYYDGEVDNASWSSFSGANTQRAEQTSRAFYVQNVTDLTEKLALTIGARTQRVAQRAEDFAAAMVGSTTRSRDAWDLGLSAGVTESLRLFAKTGRTFRFPNTDELFGFDPLTWATIFSGDLKPQHGTLHEVGGTWRLRDVQLRASLFRTDLTDEIGYDGATGANVNLPPTRHQGLELEGQWQVSRAWNAQLAYAHTEATFRGGPNDGETIPLVPLNKATLGLSWNGGSWGNWSALANYVGSQRFSGDVANVRELKSAYTTVDAQVAWQLRPWTLTVRVANLFDRRYASFAGYSTFYSDYFYYPADPRSVFVTAAYDFR